MVTHDATFCWPCDENRIILDKMLRRKLENLANRMLDVQKPLIEYGRMLHDRDYSDYTMLIDCAYYPETKTLHFY